MVVVGSGPGRPEPGGGAQRAADRLALALEDVGFDVGRDFPSLSSGVDRAGAPVVQLGQVTAPVADGLASVLSQAAQHGAAVVDGDA